MRLKGLTEEKVVEIVELGRWHPPKFVAAKMAVTERTVVKLLVQEGLTPLRDHRPRKDRTLTPPEPRLRFDPEEARRNLLAALAAERKPNPMDVARAAFEHRLAEGTCLKLDGVPVTYFELIRRANRELRRLGLPLLTACEAWL